MGKKYIVKWNKEGMVLSDGSHSKEFTDPQEALNALQSEVEKFEKILPYARNVIKMGTDTDEYYRLAELEIVVNGSQLFGVSDYFLRPLYGDNSVTEIKFKGSWYKNVQDRYMEPESGAPMPSPFLEKSNVGEYIVYFSHILLHVADGFISADREDLSNYCYI